MLPMRSSDKTTKQINKNLFGWMHEFGLSWSTLTGRSHAMIATTLKGAQPKNDNRASEVQARSQCYFKLILSRVVPEMLGVWISEFEEGHPKNAKYCGDLIRFVPIFLLFTPRLWLWGTETLIMPSLFSRLAGPPQGGQGANGQYVYWISFALPAEQTVVQNGIKTLADFSR